jgi:hypothetical protein
MKQHIKNDVAVALLLSSVAFCVGAIPAAVLLMLLTESPIFGWAVAAFFMSTITISFTSQIFEPKKVPNGSPQVRQFPKSWYRRHSLVIGLVSGFAATFFTAGLRLDIL